MTSGTNVSPLLTWDSKTTTVLAALGGVAELNRQYIEAADADLLPRLINVIDREWSRVFSPLMGPGGVLPGETLPFAAPNAAVPPGHAPFAGCQPAKSC